MKFISLNPLIAANQAGDGLTKVRHGNTLKSNAFSRKSGGFFRVRDGAAITPVTAEFKQ
jgi:hypothetical protein